MSQIAENLQRVRALMAEAAAKSGRQPEGIRLIAVSKGRPLEMIEEARKAGHKAFGENRAQELRDKMGEAPADIEWHFIGHLQTNKVNIVVGKVSLIHSIDSERLAGAVSARAGSLGVRQDVLAQINVSGEESKYGMDVEGVSRLVDMILGEPQLRLRGLMTIAPLVERTEESRPCFRRLRELRDELSDRFPQADLSCLSMGMSQDYQIAIEEGSNMVRIGTAIFSD
jgi:pyridoxal phosphate enzyme (YggS family)